MVSTISQSPAAPPATTQIAVNGQELPASTLTAIDFNRSDELAAPGNGQPKRRTESRRASNQSKELSNMDLPDPSRLNDSVAVSSFSRPTVAEPGLLSADLDPSPLVRSIPSSPYLGATTPSSSNIGLPKFGDTDKQDQLVEKLENLELPEPEIFTPGSRRATEEKARVATEFGDVWSNLDLPEPEYITRAALRAQGAKTPEPTPQMPGEPVSNATALRRHSSVKKPF